MPDVIWQEPPKTAWQERLEPVLEKPGKWARVQETSTVEYAHNLAWKLRNRVLNVPEGEWGFKSGKYKDGGAVWARYLGPEEKVVA